MLTSQQVEAFKRDGFFVVPNVFSPTEIEALKAAAATVSSLDVPQRILENDGTTVRSVYDVQNLDPLFARLIRDPRLLLPAREVLEDDVYIFQTQLNPKAAFLGDVWEWHQDLLYWQREDGMPSHRVVNVAIYLDDVTIFNGPMFFIPGSHETVLDEETPRQQPGWEAMLTSDIQHKVSNEALARLVDAKGLAAPLAERGSVVLFDSRLLHSSPPNLSPFVRTVLFVRYNALSNELLPVESPRPEWLANRHPERIEPLTDDLLAVISR